MIVRISFMLFCGIFLSAWPLMGAGTDDDPSNERSTPHPPPISIPLPGEITDVSSPPRPPLVVDTSVGAAVLGAATSSAVASHLSAATLSLDAPRRISPASTITRPRKPTNEECNLAAHHAALEVAGAEGAERILRTHRTMSVTAKDPQSAVVAGGGAGGAGAGTLTRPVALAADSASSEIEARRITHAHSNAVAAASTLPISLPPPIAVMAAAPDISTAPPQVMAAGTTGSLPAVGAATGPHTTGSGVTCNCCDEECVGNTCCCVAYFCCCCFIFSCDGDED